MEQRLDPEKADPQYRNLIQTVTNTHRESIYKSIHRPSLNFCSLLYHSSARFVNIHSTHSKLHTKATVKATVMI